MIAITMINRPRLKIKIRVDYFGKKKNNTRLKLSSFDQVLLRISYIIVCMIVCAAFYVYIRANQCASVSASVSRVKRGMISHSYFELEKNAKFRKIVEKVSR